MKQEIFELETLNRHIQQEHEALRIHNKIDKTKNDNIIFHLGLCYKKNKKLKQNNTALKRKVINLKYKILMKRPRMAVAKKKIKNINLDVREKV